MARCTQAAAEPKVSFTYPAQLASGPMVLWLGEHSGLTSSSIAQSAAPEDRRELAAVDRRPGAEQAAWFEANRVALRSCTTSPRLLAKR